MAKTKQNPAVQAEAPEKEAAKLSLGERFAVFKSNRIVGILTPFVFLAVTIILFGVLTSGRMLTANNMQKLLNQGLIYAALATAVSVIYTMGDLDISIGAVMGVGAMLGAMAYNATSSTVVLVVVTIGSCLGLMMINCTLGTVLGLKSMSIAVIMMQIYSQIQNKVIGASGAINVDFAVMNKLEGVLRYPLFFGYVILVFVIFQFTFFGRADRFFGGNPICAQQTGIRANQIKYIAYVLAGLGVGVAAMLSIMRTGSVSTSTGNQMGTYCMLMTVLGGMSIFGGARSNTYAGLIGALTYTALNMGLQMLNVSSSIIQGIRGVIFLILVYVNSEQNDLLPSRQMF